MGKNYTGRGSGLLLLLTAGIYLSACCLVYALDVKEAQRQQAERTQAMVELIADLPS